ncbi:MAG: YHS domain-containing protein [Methanobacterium sp.]|nr:YHS domain-containing protein [Methanobacterium sp.]
MLLDPVFRKEVHARKARFLTGYKGKIYYFCSVCSKKLFEEHPEKYIKIK